MSQVGGASDDLACQPIVFVAVGPSHFAAQSENRWTEIRLSPT